MASWLPPAVLLNHGITFLFYLVCEACQFVSHMGDFCGSYPASPSGTVALAQRTLQALVGGLFGHLNYRSTG
ncbi:hypothetical protein F4680DRAFT_437199 [Xylaria scruposa]|nr:hypothetical protein F4680DRAFT_437199 [Xylaria scruposa]